MQPVNPDSDMMLSSVMIIEDNEADQFISRLELERHCPGVRVLTAYDGIEALELLAQIDRDPEVIFLDINMPRMNGHEFLSVYSKQYPQHQSEVIILTSSDQTRDKNNTAQYECVKDYWLKPLDVTSLQRLCSS